MLKVCGTADTMRSRKEMKERGALRTLDSQKRLPFRASIDFYCMVILFDAIKKQ